MPPSRFKQLSAPRRSLIALLQRLNFGTIHDLEVRDGEPVVDPAPRTVREIRIPGENEPRPEGSLADYNLKAEAIALLDELTRIGTGTIERIEVKHGLPFRLFLEEQN